MKSRLATRSYKRAPGPRRGDGWRRISHHTDAMLSSTPAISTRPAGMTAAWAWLRCRWTGSTRNTAT